MTVEEAIKVLEDGDWWHFFEIPYDEHCHDEFFEAFNMALSSLRTKQKENEPLAAEELDRLAKQPIYFVPLDGNGVKARWVIYDGLMVGAKSSLDEGPIYIYYFRGDYGVRWLAYRHPPKEEQHEN